jgi:hypothetical protein
MLRKETSIHRESVDRYKNAAMNSNNMLNSREKIRKNYIHSIINNNLGDYVNDTIHAPSPTSKIYLIKNIDEKNEYQKNGGKNIYTNTLRYHNNVSTHFSNLILSILYNIICLIMRA